MLPLQSRRDRDQQGEKAVLLSRLEEAEAGERAAMLEASRVGEDNERLKVGQAMFESDDCYHRLSHRIGACNFPSLCFF